jgi:branched-chain amino acid transport system permease protein
VNRAAFVRAVKGGLLGGVGVIYFALVGMIERLDTLAIVGSVELSWLLILGPGFIAAYVLARPRVEAGEMRPASPSRALGSAAIAGFVSWGLVAIGVGLVEWIGVDTVRSVFRSVSPALIEILTLHHPVWPGILLLAPIVIAGALAGGALPLLARRVRRPVITASGVVLLLGLLQQLVPPALDQLHIQRNWLYSNVTLGLSWIGAIVAFAVTFLITWFLQDRSVRDLIAGGPGARERPGGEARVRTVLLIAWLALGAVLLAMPYLVGPVVSRDLGFVGIYLLLGLGLNIVVGYAGLLDLGYVAFFSVGAYTTAVLTGGQLNTYKGLAAPVLGAHLNFFLAIPIVVLVAALIGVAIGAPVLRLRGDYLAIVTLGFGEIARVIFGSTWAKNLFGGSAGMTHITDAAIGGYSFRSELHFYYLALGFCALAAFVSWRLQGSRIGRAWNAMREDEQVAEAMGISTIRYKLLAFAMGGAVGSLGGALFAVSVGSLTIASFTIFVSITALAIIILGGIGSIPGVVVGALILIGLPGVLTPLQDYQLLIYGAVLIAIMILRPQGLVPNVRRSRELHEEEVQQDAWMRPVEEGEVPVARGIEA